MMRLDAESAWECVAAGDEHRDPTFRQPVPGGWLYRYDGALAFVSDANDSSVTESEIIKLQKRAEEAERRLAILMDPLPVGKPFKPSIDELEEIMKEGPDTVRILPDGHCQHVRISAVEQARRLGIQEALDACAALDPDGLDEGGIEHCVETIRGLLK